MCFRETPQGFESIKPINIIIGMNNSGKSRLLDMLHFAVNQGEFEGKKLEGRDAEILLSFPLIESELKSVFSSSHSTGSFSGGFGSDWEVGRRFIGKLITISIKNASERKFVGIDSVDLKSNEFREKLAKAVRNPFEGKIIRKISAERDINSSSDMSVSTIVQSDGSGATTNLNIFINNANFDRELVDTNLLTDLNTIVSPDTYFEGITVRSSDNNIWEIFLKENGKGWIPLSRSGSGLKTIILVLINVLLIPKKECKSHDNYIFLFEELENNLHPAIQRRLLSYIKKIALEMNATFFITTHSNVVIDLFSKDANAQIYHITQDAIVKNATTYIETSGILDDLDIRASDLLQSNGLIWVEGPSDRIYMNKFIELWSGGSITEGLNYQCIFYGGRIRAHLTSDVDDGQQKKLFEILLTNRHAIMLMDSDKETGDDGIDATKERIKAEFEKNKKLCWTTDGRTIENYIPQNAIESLYNMKMSKQLGKYDDYRVYLEESLPNDSEKFYKRKVLFAEKIRPHLQKENLEKIYDINDKMNEVIAEIKNWNKI